MKAVVHDLAMV